MAGSRIDRARSRMTPEDLLRTFEFHDLHVLGLRFLFGNDDDPHALVLDFGTWDDESSSYNRWTLLFNDLLSLSTTGIELDGHFGMEVYSFDLAGDAVLKGGLCILTGPGKPELRIVFECRSFSLVGGQHG